eukprot:1136444-Pelagomonas_calceolata.AAC.1
MRYPLSGLHAVLVPHERDILRELVAVLGLQVAAHIHHQLVHAGSQVSLALIGLAGHNLGLRRHTCPHQGIGKMCGSATRSGDKNLAPAY